MCIYMNIYIFILSFFWLKFIKCVCGLRWKCCGEGVACYVHYYCCVAENLHTWEGRENAGGEGGPEDTVD